MFVSSFVLNLIKLIENIENQRGFFDKKRKKQNKNNNKKQLPVMVLFVLIVLNGFYRFETLSFHANQALAKVEEK